MNTITIIIRIHIRVIGTVSAFLLLSPALVLVAPLVSGAASSAGCKRRIGALNPHGPGARRFQKGLLVGGPGGSSHRQCPRVGGHKGGLASAPHQGRLQAPHVGTIIVIIAIGVHSHYHEHYHQHTSSALFISILLTLGLDHGRL